MTVQAISPIALPDLKIGATPANKPEIAWFAPTELMVDHAYQRDLSAKSLALIRKIVEGWDWAKFKVPVAAWTDAGLTVIDGQHTAVAACMRPDIEAIPVMIVELREQQGQASAFLSHNTDRITATKAQLHAAAVVAGDPEAVAIDALCASAGVRLLRHHPARAFKIGETMAVTIIRGMRGRVGDSLAEVALKILVAAECAPIGADHLRAVEHLIADKEFEGQFDPADLSRLIASMGKDAEREAKAFAATHCVPKWKGLASVWFKNVRKRRRVAPQPQSAGPQSAPNLPNFAGKGADSHPNEPPTVLQESPANVEPEGAIRPLLKPAIVPRPVAAKMPAAYRTVDDEDDEDRPRPAPKVISAQARAAAAAIPADSVPFRARVSHVRGAPVLLGDEPPPGRSALDQRRAEGKR